MTRVIQVSNNKKLEYHYIYSYYKSIYTSIAKNTPAIGALKPAATPAAAPALSKILFLWNSKEKTVKKGIDKWNELYLVYLKRKVLLG